MKAIWNNTIIAESDETVEVEGNHYFPKNSLVKHFFHPNDYHTVCHWKGQASYYDIMVNGKTNENAAWYYPDPKQEAQHIKDHIGFWNGVTVTSD